MEFEDSTGNYSFGRDKNHRYMCDEMEPQKSTKKKNSL